MFGFLVYCAIGPKLHAASDHFGWKYNAAPDWNAIITNVHTITEKVGKNDKRYKTYVEFSDGFYFYSYDTDRTDRFLTYTISLSESTRKRILENAMEEHERELAKKRIRKDLSPDMELVVGLVKFLLFCAVIAAFMSGR